MQAGGGHGGVPPSLPLPPQGGGAEPSLATCSHYLIGSQEPKARRRVVLLALFALGGLMSCQLMSARALCKRYGNWAGGEPVADVTASRGVERSSAFLPGAAETPACSLEWGEKGKCCLKKTSSVTCGRAGGEREPKK